MPVHAVIGNHDYLPGSFDRSAYLRVFPKQLNYRFTHRGWQILGLDTSEGTLSQGTTISAATLAWLDENLPKIPRGAPVIVLTHFPLGEGVFGRPVNAEAVLQRLAQVNLQAVFSGHFHGYTERALGPAVLTTDKCCSRVRGNHDMTPEKGWFVGRAAGGKISRQFVQLRT